MIVKRNLSTRAVLRYTARQLAGASAWALAAPLAYELSREERLLLPFAPVAALAAALAIVIPFRNSAAFARWNEARAAWQAAIVACRSLARQIVTATADAAAAGAVTAAEADRTARELVLRLAVFPRLVEGGVRPPVDWARVEALVPSGEAAALRAAAVPPTLLLQRQSAGIREAIRAGTPRTACAMTVHGRLLAANASRCGVLGRGDAIQHRALPASLPRSVLAAGRPRRILRQTLRACFKMIPGAS